MKRLLRITVLFSVTLLWWGEKGYAATPAMDAAEKETVSATVEAEADKKDPKSDKKSDEPKRKRNLGHLSGSFETNTIYYVEDSKTGAVVPHNSYGSNNFLKLDYQLGRFSAGVQLEYYPHPLVGTPMQGYEYVMEGFSINNLTEKYISWTDRNYSVTVGVLLRTVRQRVDPPCLGRPGFGLQQFAGRCTGHVQYQGHRGR